MLDLRSVNMEIPAPGAGRAKLRLSRGFPLGLAQLHHPHKFSLGHLGVTTN